MERLSNRAIDIVNELHTERLDYKSEYLPIIDALNQLASYEETGLTPEEIRKAQEALAPIPFSRYRYIMEAERDGRLVVPPVKVGDEVYWIIYDQVPDEWYIGEPEKIADVGTKGFYLAVDEPDTPDEFHAWDELGDEVFLSRKEAEAKLVEIQTEKAALERGGSHV